MDSKLPQLRAPRGLLSSPASSGCFSLELQTPASVEEPTFMQFVRLSFNLEKSYSVFGYVSLLGEPFHLHRSLKSAAFTLLLLQRLEQLNLLFMEHAAASLAVSPSRLYVYVCKDASLSPLSNAAPTPW